MPWRNYDLAETEGFGNLIGIKAIDITFLIAIRISGSITKLEVLPGLNSFGFYRGTPKMGIAWPPRLYDFIPFDFFRFEIFHSRFHEKYRYRSNLSIRTREKISIVRVNPLLSGDLLVFLIFLVPPCTPSTNERNLNGIDINHRLNKGAER